MANHYRSRTSIQTKSTTCTPLFTPHRPWTAPVPTTPVRLQPVALFQTQTQSTDPAPVTQTTRLPDPTDPLPLPETPVTQSPEPVTQTPFMTPSISTKIVPSEQLYADLDNLFLDVPAQYCLTSSDLVREYNSASGPGINYAKHLVELLYPELFTQDHLRRYYSYNGGGSLKKIHVPLDPARLQM